MQYSSTAANTHTTFSTALQLTLTLKEI